MELLAVAIIAVGVSTALGFSLPARGRQVALVGVALAVGYWAFVLLYVGIVGGGTESSDGDGWSFGAYAVFGGVQTAVLAAVWIGCAHVGRRLRVRVR